ncbi:hypothetical protein SPBRAN_1518 [uncultured Candidatus Thioglobus sp.]|nr:hypothetical protein SPBRAN_1518 [uncultured Candidatus Thioglobus sp.]
MFPSLLSLKSWIRNFLPVVGSNLPIVSGIPTAQDEFSIQQIQQATQQHPSIKPFSSSQITQMLKQLIEKGLVYRNRHGKYMFAVPLIANFINRVPT